MCYIASTFKTVSSLSLLKTGGGREDEENAELVIFVVCDVMTWSSLWTNGTSHGYTAFALLRVCMHIT